MRKGRFVHTPADIGTGQERLRPSWYNYVCCPPNVMRLFSNLKYDLAIANESGVQTHQYATAQLDVTVHREPLWIAMENADHWSTVLPGADRGLESMRVWVPQVGEGCE